MTNADGTPVTVYVDKDFNVVSVETGGPGGHGFGGPGAPPSSSSRAARRKPNRGARRDSPFRAAGSSLSVS